MRAERSQWIIAVTLGAALTGAVGSHAYAGEWSGWVGVEHRAFSHEPLFPEQQRNYFSLAAQPEYRHRWDNDQQGITFVPFARAAHYDGERAHVDIRELNWFMVGDGYELRAGIGKVFWGVTESQHLIDIINQTDLVENIDTEDKLGQPMVKFAISRAWGTLDIFMLPGFRERSFPDSDGRLRTPLPVATERAQYESRHERERVDWAARWSKSIGAWDIGLAHFAGTSREPRLILGFDDGQLALIPFYELIHQTSLDVQSTQGAWLWKLEALQRNGMGPDYWAATGGFEYTRSGIFGTGADLGLIAEYLYDQRDERATTPFQDDVMLGARLALNDASSTEMLIGVISDRDSPARFWNIEASRRLGESCKLSLELRTFRGIPPSDPLFSAHRDDYVQLELARYF